MNSENDYEDIQEWLDTGDKDKTPPSSRDPENEARLLWVDQLLREALCHDHVQEKQRAWEIIDKAQRRKWLSVYKNTMLWVLAASLLLFVSLYFLHQSSLPAPEKNDKTVKTPGSKDKIVPVPKTKPEILELETGSAKKFVATRKKFISARLYYPGERLQIVGNEEAVLRWDEGVLSLSPKTEIIWNGKLGENNKLSLLKGMVKIQSSTPIEVNTEHASFYMERGKATVKILTKYQEEEQMEHITRFLIVLFTVHLFSGQGWIEAQNRRESIEAKKSQAIIQKRLKVPVSKKPVSKKTAKPKKWLTIKTPRMHAPLQVKTYQLMITNPTKKWASSIELSCSIPENLSYVSAKPPMLVGRKDVTLVIPRLAPGEKFMVTIDFKGTGKGRASGKFQLKWRNQTTTTSFSVFVGLIPALHVSIYDTEDPVEVGKTTTYVVEIKNKGTVPCTNVRLNNTIPYQTRWLSASGPTSFIVRDEEVFFDPVSTLLPEQKLVYKIEVLMIEEGSAKNSARVTFDQFAKTLIDEEGTSIYQ